MVSSGQNKSKENLQNQRAIHNRWGHRWRARRAEFLDLESTHLRTKGYSNTPRRRDGECGSNPKGSCRWLGIACSSCKHQVPEKDRSMTGSECPHEEEKHNHRSSGLGSRHQHPRFQDLESQHRGDRPSWLGRGGCLCLSVGRSIEQVEGYRRRDREWIYHRLRVGFGGSGYQQPFDVLAGKPRSCPW